MEAVLANVIMSNKSEELLDKCDIEGYVTSTGRINNIILWLCSLLIHNVGNLEVIFEAKDTSDDYKCSVGAEHLSNSVNSQGDENSEVANAAPIVSFLTAGSVLEEEVGSEEGVGSDEGGNGAKFLYSSFTFVLATIAAIVL